ncbi:hypothetical protein AYI70_g962 [Smittium culicis]|uniref:C3H1-type domain-containing protein n=1 Tax=Smittium culicis TaxID=133412 RepID=A0A1R1YEW1_9FUNG|nr:hypothetical protein AYI70_g962 [Smittium culicis]
MSSSITYFAASCAFALALATTAIIVIRRSKSSNSATPDEEHIKTSSTILILFYSENYLLPYLERSLLNSQSAQETTQSPTKNKYNSITEQTRTTPCLSPKNSTSAQPSFTDDANITNSPHINTVSQSSAHPSNTLTISPSTTSNKGIYHLFPTLYPVLSSLNLERVYLDHTTIDTINDSTRDPEILAPNNKSFDENPAAIENSQTIISPIDSFDKNTALANSSKTSADSKNISNSKQLTDNPSTSSINSNHCQDISSSANKKPKIFDFKNSNISLTDSSTSNTIANENNVPNTESIENGVSNSKIHIDSLNIISNRNQNPSPLIPKTDSNTFNLPQNLFTNVESTSYSDSEDESNDASLKSTKKSINNSKLLNKSSSKLLLNKSSNSKILSQKNSKQSIKSPTPAVQIFSQNNSFKTPEIAASTITNQATTNGLNSKLSSNTLKSINDDNNTSSISNQIPLSTQKTLSNLIAQTSPSKDDIYVTPIKSKKSKSNKKRSSQTLSPALSIKNSPSRICTNYPKCCSVSKCNLIHPVSPDIPKVAGRRRNRSRKMKK